MKKSKHKKAKASKASVLRSTTKSLKKLRKSKLSTTQKVLGGAALVALGLGYLAQRRGKAATAPEASADDAKAAEVNLQALDGNA